MPLLDVLQSVPILSFLPVVLLGLTAGPDEARSPPGGAITTGASDGLALR